MPSNVDTFQYVATLYGMNTERSRVLKLLQQAPLMSSAEIAAEGIDSKTLTRMVRDGELRRTARGLYTLTSYIPGTYHSLIEAGKLVDHGVVCLLSALSFHEIGTQNPSRVWLAIPRRARMPRVQDYPIQIVKFSDAAYTDGIELQTMDGVDVAVYSIPKTVADCFKYRNKIGLDVAIEALKEVIQGKRSSVDDLIHFAKLCRVEEIMRPYMEILV